MTAKTNQQTLDAVELVKKGTPITKAARDSGVHRSSIWRALQREQKKQSDKQKQGKGPSSGPLGYP